MSPSTAEPIAQWSARAIVHVDMDAFFAAIEQLDHPEWRGRPVIVGGSPKSRGVVSTASYEARAFGVHSALSSAQAERRCPEAVWAQPRFDRYVEVSRAVRDILTRYTPHLEPTSIDEAYLDVTPGATGEHPLVIAERIRADVDALGLSCSLGVATSKSVAKIASDAHKPHGITVVWPGEEAAFLAPFPVRALPGVGGATAERLNALGVRTLADLAAMDPATARRIFGTSAPGVLARARGIDVRPVEVSRDVKSVSNEHTFPTDVCERADVEHALGILVARVASRLRDKGLCARTLTVKLRFTDFTTRTVQRTFDVTTDLEDEMLPVAFDLLRAAWSPGTGLRLLGFAASGFDQTGVQLDLLSPARSETRPRHRALAFEIDAIRRRFGDDALKHGSDVVP